MTIYRQYVGKTKQEQISEAEARRRLDHTYEDVDLVFDDLRAGHKVRSMFSIYWMEDDETPIEAPEFPSYVDSQGNEHAEY